MTDDRRANPFRDLEPYTREDRTRFFGRDGDLTLVLDRVLTRRTTLLFSGSGVGKTSLLEARVIPEVENRYFAASCRLWAGGPPVRLLLGSIVAGWNHSAWRPQDAAPPPPEDEGQGALAGFYRYCRPLLRRDCSGALLILDQFEEVFHQNADTPELAVLIDALCELINAPTPDVRVLFSIREEFLGYLGVFDNRIPDLFNNYYRLRNPNRRQAHAIIANTIAQEKVEPSEALDDLINDLALAPQQFGAQPRPATALRDSIPLPFLQIACRGLWDRQFDGHATDGPAGRPASDPAPNPASGNVPTGEPPSFPAGYVSGDAVEHLQSYCGRTIGGLSTAEQDLLSEALGFLITRRGAKVAYDVNSLAEHSGFAEKTLRSLLDKLSAKPAKLFRRMESADGSTWYELYHDMYSPFLADWKAEHRKRQERRRRIRILGITGGGLAIGLSILVFMLLLNWSTEKQFDDFRMQAINTPSEVYNLRFGRHEGAVTRLAISPDGSRVITGSYDKTAKVWDFASGLAIRSLQADTRVRALAYSPAGPNRLAIGGSDHAIRVFNLNDAASEPAVLSFDSPISALVFSPDGQTLAAGGDQPEVRLYDTAGKSRRYRVKANVTALACLHDGQLLVGDTEGSVSLVSEEKRELLLQQTRPVLGLAVSADGRFIASGSADMSIRVLEIASRTDFALPGHTAWVRSVAFSPDGTILASGGSEGAVRLWDLKTHSQIATLMGHLGPVYAVAFHPSGKALLSSGQDQTVRVWDVGTRTQQRDLEGSWEVPEISRFAADLTMTVLEGNSGIRVFSGAGVKKGYPEATALALTRDGATLAFGKADGSVWLDRGTREEKEVARIPTRVRGLVFSGDGTVLAIHAADARTLRIVSIDSEGNANPGGEFTTEEQSWFVALDDSGNSIAMCDKHTGWVYSRDNSSAPKRIRRSTDIIGITYDAFRQPVLLYTDKSVEFFESPMPPVHLRSSPAGNSQLAAVSENGKVFAFAQRNGDVYVWSGGGAPLHFSLPERLLAMSFSRDGNRLGTLDRTGAVRIYDIRIAGRNAGAGSGVLPSTPRP